MPGARCCDRPCWAFALHDVQQRFADDVPPPPACLVRRQGGGLLWRKRSATPDAQTLFELADELGRELKPITHPAAP
jgi:hypothetical protein